MSTPAEQEPKMTTPADETATTPADETAANTGYTLTDGGTVTLGRTTYTVEIQDYLETGGRMVWLTGPKGGVYFLRAYSNRNGHFQVIRWGSGASLRSKGNEVTVYMLGDVIEQAGR
jgi:hypothetical protein